jgi:hypothetical protein
VVFAGDSLGPVGLAATDGWAGASTGASSPKHSKTLAPSRSQWSVLIHFAHGGLSDSTFALSSESVHPESQVDSADSHSRLYCSEQATAADWDVISVPALIRLASSGFLVEVPVSGPTVIPHVSGDSWWISSL